MSTGCQRSKLFLGSLPPSPTVLVSPVSHQPRTLRAHADMITIYIQSMMWTSSIFAVLVLVAASLAAPIPTK
jgi:hypothetical protein